MPKSQIAVPLGAATLGSKEWTDVAVPRYDRRSVTVGVVHFGVGGFHRAHQAMYIDTLMNDGIGHDWGICGVGLMPADRRMRDVMRTQDCLYTLITKTPGTRSARVIGSIVEYLFAPEQTQEVLDRLSGPEVRVVTMTVTEAGYNVHRVSGEFDPCGPGIEEDLARPGAPRTVFGFIVEALARRRAAGIAPFTVVSCDNVQSNGQVTRSAISGYARLRDPDLAEWIEHRVPFPNSMVDRITPATTDADCRMVDEQFGIADEWPVVCEPFTQWVLEDDFAVGRPPLEQVGVQVVSDVEPYELMKLRLLNGGHQALGYAAYLAGYRYVHEAVADPAFAALLQGYMHEEAAPSLVPVPGVDLDGYMRTLLQRFGNPEIRDTLARLCVDSSERIPKFVLPVIRHQLAAGGPIDRAVAVIASWARYAEGSDDRGEPIELVDPARAELTAAAQGRAQNPLSFVQNRDIFGELADNERFVGSYRQSLDCLVADGAQVLVETLARSGSWE